MLLTESYSNTFIKEGLVRILLWNIAEFEFPSVASVAFEVDSSADKVPRQTNGTDYNEIILKMFL